MGEPLSLATKMLKLITNAVTASKEVYSAIEAISNAPNHIKAISSDLEDFYSILGSLKGYLEDVDMSTGVLQAAEKVNIASVIENCLHIFTRISLLVNSYNSRGRRGGIGDMGNWRKVKYSFRIAETEALRSQLAAHKMTLNMAISLVNFINLNTANINAQRVEDEIANHMRELEEKLPILSRCLEDVAADALPRPEVHSRSDRDQLLEDYDFTVRRYLGSASSVISEACTPDTASMRVSSLGATDTNGSTYISFYETAKTHISEAIALATVIENDEDDEDDCTQIFVKGPYDHTTVLPVEPGFTIEHINEMLCLQAQVPNGTNVSFTFGGQILNEARLLRDYKVPQNATIFCNIRACTGPPIDRIFVIMDTGRTFGLSIDSFKTDSLIYLMGRLIYFRTGLLQEEQILIFSGETLDPYKTLADYRIWGGSTVHLTARPCISVRTLGREPILLPLASFGADADSSISTMMGLIEEQGGAPQDQQRLYYHGCELDRAKFLADYGISGGSTVQLVWRHQWGRAERYTSSAAGNGTSSDVGSIGTKSKWRSKLSAVPLLRGARV